MIISFSCEGHRKTKLPLGANETFESELLLLQDYFSIPGIAAIVEQNGKIVYENYHGYANIEKKIKVDSTTVFPIASLTKIYATVLILQQVEEGKLSLEEPINKFLDNTTLSDSIKIKHILSHTSQGSIGDEFFYSARFGLLTQVLEKTSGKSLEQLVQENILAPLKLEHTLLLNDSAQLANKSISFAQPYLLDNGIEKGFVDFGYSAAAGLAANARELMQFNIALDENKLIEESTKNEMCSPFKKGLPYGYGIFTQEVEGIDIIWGYGQYDCYSSLLMKIPAQNISMVLLANNNLMSDPARLIMGNITTSLFAISFLKNYVLEKTDIPILENSDTLASIKTKNVFLDRDKLLAQALAESFMARFSPDRFKTSEQLLNEVFNRYPDFLNYADINLLHTLCFLKDVAFYMELGPFNTFDKEIEQIGGHLLKSSPNNPYLHSYLGLFYNRKGEMDKARYHFEHIVNAQNFSNNWYTVEAKNWLGQH